MYHQPGLKTVEEFMGGEHLSKLLTGPTEARAWGRGGHYEGTFDLTFEHMEDRMDAVRKVKVPN